MRVYDEQHTTKRNPKMAKKLLTIETLIECYPSEYGVNKVRLTPERMTQLTEKFGSSCDILIEFDRAMSRLCAGTPLTGLESLLLGYVGIITQHETEDVTMGSRSALMRISPRKKLNNDADGMSRDRQRSPGRVSQMSPMRPMRLRSPVRGIKSEHSVKPGHATGEERSVVDR